MKNNYILIDFENVQPKNLEVLNRPDVQLILFVGANQNKIPFASAALVQSMGDKARYQKISGNGPNALDFHIAFYIGELAATDPDAFYHVISRDKGFDPLLEHLRERKILARRHTDVAEIPILRRTRAASMDEKIDEILTKLRSLGASRPRKRNTLASTVNALYYKTLDDPALTKIIAELQRRKHIIINEQKVSYGASITSPKKSLAA